jgi:putative IMPACT (imprinted ancient) family translation regulator
LLRAELSGVLAVVTRYYGGIKLGVKGLIEAYTQAVSETVKISDLVEYQSFKYYQIKCSYAHLEIIRHQLSCFKYQELSAQYAESVLLSIKVPEAQDQEVRGFLDGYLALGRLEYNLEV